MSRLQRKVAATPLGAPAGEDERHMSALASAIDTVRAGLNAGPFAAVDGVLLKAKTLAAGASTKVPHGLGRVPVGWIIARATGSAPQVYQTASDANYLTLTHSGASATVVDIWVY